MIKANHQERKHSKFSASGAEIYFNCPGSVDASEGLPDKDTPWSLEGTEAHETLEEVLRGHRYPKFATVEMVKHANDVKEFIYPKVKKGCELLIEQRVSLAFIHPEAFGTLDISIVEHFGTLHVFDYKFGKSAVSPIKNKQMIFYALGVAYKYDWNFSKIRIWIIQPRSAGYDGPVYWDLTITELMKWVPKYKKAMRDAEIHTDVFREGSWCHWCKAGRARKCPLKQEKNAKQAFKPLR